MKVSDKMWVEQPKPTEDEVVAMVKAAGADATTYEEIVKIHYRKMNALLDSLGVDREQFCRRHRFEKAHWNYEQKAWQLRLADSDYVWGMYDD